MAEQVLNPCPGTLKWYMVHGSGEAISQYTSVQVVKLIATGVANYCMYTKEKGLIGLNAIIN